ncbi:MAG: hypothetical protein D6757_08360 [Alphaproteobacteria bacterium]|nr:MAG: hypothetical protein D6757_08360 [Alphaproteobacteria bacterium]
MNGNDTNTIQYDELVQDALRGVIRRLLEDVAKRGLPGAHHFYIAFQTRHPGVEMPDELRQRYPDEMTIVLQHRFWDLKVHEDRFEVGLSFNRQPAHLVIPLAAIIGFVDPSSQFALQFQPPEPEAPVEGPRIVTEGQHADNQDGEPAGEDSDNAGTSGGVNGGTEDESGKVVALDTFRKKT